MNYSNYTLPPSSVGLPGGNYTNSSSVFTHEVLPVLYALICAVGMILNGFAAWIFFRVPSTSGLVVYLKNILVADLLMLFSFPWRVVKDRGLGGSYLELVVCRYTAVLFYIGMYTGIIFMSLISLERYIKIVHASSCSARPCSLWVSSFLQQVIVARCLVLLSWALMLLCMLPNTLLTNKPAVEGSSCMDLKSELGRQWHKVSAHCAVGIFWVSLVLMTFCYSSISYQVYHSYQRVKKGRSKAKQKSNQSIFSLLAVFFFCFVPYHVCRVPYTMSQSFNTSLSNQTQLQLFQAKEVTLFMASFNVCLDPLVYFLMCRAFRELFLQKLSTAETINGIPSVTLKVSTSNL
ncbi:P2Y purinoceptor 14 [Tachysurus ichikawai]